MSKIIPAVALSAALTFSASGCASGLGNGNGGLTPSNAETLVQVDNNNWADMNIYVVRSGMRMRLGTVVSMNSATFVVPEPMVSASGEVRLLADPIGGAPQFMTQPVLVSPGQQIEFTLENNLNLSSLSVW